MKIVINVLFFISVFFSSCKIVFAADIALIDFAKIIQTSAAGKKIIQQLQAYEKAIVAALEKEEKKLLDQGKKVGENPSAFSEDQLNKMRQERVFFENKKRNYGQALQMSQADSFQALNQEVLKIANVMMDSGKYKIFILRDQVYLFHPSIDITDEILKKLNANVKSISVKDPEKFYQELNQPAKSEKPAKTK